MKVPRTLACLLVCLAMAALALGCSRRPASAAKGFGLALAQACRREGTAVRSTKGGLD